MPDQKALRLDLTHVLERFPDRVALVRRLASENEVFRSICEDFELARSTLVKLSTLPESDRNPAVLSDYESVVADLEKDIAAALRSADQVE